jgi:lipid-binding SYLF domain-containing protein
MVAARTIAILLAAVALVAALPSRGLARSEEATVQAAGEVLTEFVNMRMKDIPLALLADAKGVAIIPNLVKVGFVIGGQRGKGVVMVREADGSWRAPVFLTLTGGSVGWQAGAQSSDIVLVFKTQKSVQGLLEGKFTLGADAAVAAGPVGRRAAAATDENLKAEIYSYSRSRGLFAGVSIDGSVLEINDAATAAYYGAASAGGAAPAIPESAAALVSAVAKLTVDPTDEPASQQPLGPQAALIPRNDLPVLADPRGAPTPASDADAIRAELAKSASALNPLLDQSWRRYLALPAEVYQTGGHPAPEVLAASLKSFDTIARTPDYRALASRPEFQATHRALATYQSALSRSGTPQLALPPPPAAQR